MSPSRPLAVAFFSCTAAVALTCPPGFELALDDSKCYSILPAEHTFLSCASQCDSFGASMPCVRDSRDNRELKSLTDRYGAWWVGIYQDPSRDYRSRLGWNLWAAANCTSRYSSWDEHEPNDFDCLHESCAIANIEINGRRSTSRYRWLDDKCDRRRVCVCQWPGSQAPALTTHAQPLIRRAGQPLSRASGCLLSTDLEAFAGFRLMLPLVILFCTAAGVSSIIRQRRRRARDPMAFGRDGRLRPMGASVPAAIAMSALHNSRSVVQPGVATAIPVAQGNPVAAAVPVVPIHGVPVSGSLVPGSGGVVLSATGSAAGNQPCDQPIATATVIASPVPVP